MDILDLAGRAGTLPMQVLLLVALIILGIVIIKLHRKREEENRRQHDENQAQLKANEGTNKQLLEKLQLREDAMTEERRDRIKQLMSMIEDDVGAKRDIAHALQNNTSAIESLQTLIRERIPHK